jgi:hypothetical protein
MSHRRVMLISTRKQLAFRLLSDTQQYSLVSGVGYVGLAVL